MTTFFLRCEAARGQVYACVGVQSLRWRSDGGGGGTQWILGALLVFKMDSYFMYQIVYTLASSSRYHYCFIVLLNADHIVPNVDHVVSNLHCAP